MNGPATNPVTLRNPEKEPNMNAGILHYLAEGYAASAMRYLEMADRLRASGREAAAQANEHWASMETQKAVNLRAGIT